MEEEDVLFLKVEFLIFFIILVITLIEVYNFSFFEKVIGLIKAPASWFIGLSFGIVFSNIIKPIKEKVKKKINTLKENFLLYLANLIIAAGIAGFVKSLTLSFFNNFFIYFHILFMQWLILVYIFFKVSHNYSLSKRYIIVNEAIFLFYDGQ